MLNCADMVSSEYADYKTFLMCSSSLMTCDVETKIPDSRRKRYFHSHRERWWWVCRLNRNWKMRRASVIII